MTHMKRIAMPRSWPLSRKEAKYVAVCKGKKLELSMPLLLVLRDLLKIGQTRREIKKILNSGEILIDEKARKEEKFPVGIFDVVAFPRIKKFYRMSISEKKKLFLQEIKEQEAREKICKVIGKKMLKGKRMQINLHDNRNYFYENARVNDSVVLDLEKNRIKERLPLQKNAKVFFVSGKHAGSEGIVFSIEGREIVVNANGKEARTNAKNIIVVK